MRSRTLKPQKRLIICRTIVLDQAGVGMIGYVDVPSESQTLRPIFKRRHRPTNVKSGTSQIFNWSTITARISLIHPEDRSSDVQKHVRSRASDRAEQETEDKSAKNPCRDDAACKIPGCR